MNTSRRQCVVANWKMYGSLSMVQAWIKAWLSCSAESSSLLGHVDVVICPPVVYLPQLLGVLWPDVQLGAQNAYYEEAGAFTGELSPIMLKEAACSHVIVGHSERRMLFNESNELVARKFKAVYDVGLTPILCLGETYAEREAGLTQQVIIQQLEAVISVSQLSYFRRAMIAYEPVWAIGTGLSATPEQSEEVHIAIREYIAQESSETAQQLRILYGGSVKPSNAEALFAQPNIDGALVGGASLDAREFFNICKHIKGVF